MKRILSMALAFMLAAAVFTVPAGAAEVSDEQTEVLYQKYCAHYKLIPHETHPEIGEIGWFELRGFSGDWALCYTLLSPQPAFYQVKLGGYVIAPGTWGFPVSTCISVISLTSDTVYELEDAYTAGIIDMADVKRAFPDIVMVSGDWNSNDKLSLADVLMLQKYLAKIIESPGEPYTLAYLAADLSGDGTLDLNDVVMMQKVLAKVM